MLKSVFFRSRVNGLTYLIRNVWATRGMGKIPTVTEGNYTFSGLKPDMVERLDRLNQQMGRGNKLGLRNKILLKLRGESLCGVVLNCKGELLGYQLHYFRKGDLNKRIILVDYSFIIPAERKKGLAVRLRRHIAEYYAANGIKGLAAYIRVNNLPALKTAKSIGYQFINNPKLNHTVVSMYLDLSKYNK